MEITQIENKIAELALAQGYKPLIVSEEKLERGIDSFPMAWIQLPKVLYVEGRDEGVICHQVTVALLDDYSAYNFEDKRVRLDEMQRDVIEIMTKLSTCEGVIEVNEMKVSPRLTHITRHGDVAQLCQANVVTYF